jgi:protein TorT
MGAKAGEVLAKAPAGARRSGGLVPPARSGLGGGGQYRLQGAIKGSAVQVVETKYGDTGKEVQSKLVEDTLQAPGYLYIVGTG